MVRTHTTTGHELVGPVRTAYELGKDSGRAGGTLWGATRGWRDFANALKLCATDATIDAATDAYTDGVQDGRDGVPS